MGHFKIKSRLNLDELSSDAKIEESDYATITPQGNFVQLEYIEDEDQPAHKYDVKPGIWTIQKSQMGLFLQPTSFTKDKILTTFSYTQQISKIADCFFSKFDVYRKYGIEVPKRGCLLFGPAGSSKSTSINLVCEKYVADHKTAVIIWTTDKFEAHVVKDFIKTFNYVNGVEKIILVAEDIGGIESDKVRVASDSSLLSLLDNKEKTFTIPTLIIATTNFPEVFMGNLTNRPDRFDDKIRVDFPDAEQRLKLLDFFLGKRANKKMKDLLKSDACKEFTPAHIRDIGLRMDLFDKTGEEVIKEMMGNISDFKNEFAKPQKSLGSFFDDDE